MKIEVLGPGCQKCKKLYELVEEVVKDLYPDADLQKVEDVNRMVELGMWATPGIAVDGEVVSTGRVPSVKEIHEILSALAPEK